MITNIKTQEKQIKKTGNEKIQDARPHKHANIFDKLCHKTDSTAERVTRVPKSEQCNQNSGPNSTENPTHKDFGQ